MWRRRCPLPGASARESKGSWRGPEHLRHLCHSLREGTVAVFDLLPVAEIPERVEEPGKAHDALERRLGRLARGRSKVPDVRFEGDREVLGLKRRDPDCCEVALANQV